MRRALVGVLAVSFFAVPCVAQSGTAGYGVAGMETPSGTPSWQAEAAKVERKAVDERFLRSPLYEIMVRSAEQGCPVAMEAKRLGGGDMVRAGKSVERGQGQRIRLILHDRSNSAKVVGARVAVRGTDGKARMSTLASSQAAGLTSGPVDSRDRAGEVTKTVTLNLTDRGESWAATDLLLRGLTSVSRVRLESLTYEDGTTWQPEQGSLCAVAPSPLMLVGGSR